MEYKVGDRVKFKNYYDLCGKGVVTFNSLGVGTVKYPDGMIYTLNAIKDASQVLCKVIGIYETKEGVEYKVSWVNKYKVLVTFRIKAYLLSHKVISIIKCEISDEEKVQKKNKIKENIIKTRKEHNKRVNKLAQLTEGK